MELYNEAKGQNLPTTRDEWNRRGERLEIVSGFYLDSRSYLKGKEKYHEHLNYDMKRIDSHPKPEYEKNHSDTQGVLDHKWRYVTRRTIGYFCHGFHPHLTVFFLFQKARRVILV